MRPTSCYACAVDISGRGQKLAKMQFRWDLYEQMVEFLETLPAGSVINIPWLAREAYDWDAGMPDRYAVARLVVRDMYHHKILRPVRVRLGGNVYQYRKAL